MTQDRRHLPHHAEAEASILGGVLLRNDVLRDLRSLETQSFYDFRHQAVWSAMRNLEAQNQPIDVVTLEARLVVEGKLDAIGGPAFLGELTLRVPTVDNVHAYAGIVRDQHMLRKLMLATGAAASAGHNFVDNPGELLAETIADLQRIQHEHRAPGAAQTPRGFAPMPQRVDGERARRLAAAARGIRVDNAYLDDRLRLILPHDLVILTARSGAGKTEQALSIAMASAMKGHRVGYFALEAEPDELERRAKYRWLSRTAYLRRLPGHEHLDFKDWLVGDCEDIVGGIEHEADAWFADTLGRLFTFYKLEERFDVEEMVRRIVEISDQVDMIVLDHLHYIDGDKGANDNQTGTRVAHALRGIALVLGKPVIAVAHLRKFSGGGAARTLLPDQEEIMGPSDLYKITTHIVALGPAPFVTPPKWYLAPTLIGVVKDRTGGNDGLAALTYFDKRTRMYSRNYTLGRLTKNGTEWEALTIGDKPRWAKNHQQLELEIEAA